MTELFHLSLLGVILGFIAMLASWKIVIAWIALQAIFDRDFRRDVATVFRKFKC